MIYQGLALLTLSWDKNWDSHSLVNGYPSFYPRIALVTRSPEDYLIKKNKEFSNMTSDWLAAVLPANQKPC